MLSALSSKHPLYSSRFEDWILMRDSHMGERRMKDKGIIYLPATSGMNADGMTDATKPGWKAYEAYKLRAVYHEIVRPALEAMVGVMHRRPPNIELPPQLEDMRNSATFDGESLETLLRKINTEQLLIGRLGLFLDVQDGAPVNQLPYILTYAAEHIFNWDATHPSDSDGRRKLGLVVLNESDFERTQGLAWQEIVKYRVLATQSLANRTWGEDAEGVAPADANGATEPNRPPPDDTYVAASARVKEDVALEDFTAPSVGGVTLDHIPFVFVGPRDLAPEPDVPPLLALARIAISIYRTEADYRQSLHQQGQDTLVLIGSQADDGDAVRVGATSTIFLPIGGSAEYVGADAGGINELADSIQADKKTAAQLGANMLDQKGNDAESAEALHIRVASRHATLTTVAKASAEGLQRILRDAAVWAGADPDKVKVQPNLDFTDEGADAASLVALMNAKMFGAPISKKSIHWFMSRHDMTPLDYEQELEEIEDEAPLPGEEGLGGPGDDPNDPRGEPGDGNKDINPFQVKKKQDEGDAPGRKKTTVKETIREKVTEEDGKGGTPKKKFVRASVKGGKK